MAAKKQSLVKEFARRSAQIAHFYDGHLCDQFDADLESELRSGQYVPKSRLQKIRRKGRHVLHSRPVLIIIVLLCVVDCILVIGELILDMHAIKELKSEHGSANAHEDNSSSVVHHRTERAASGASGQDEHHEHPIEEKIAHGFHYASIAILGVLLVETILKIFFLGRQFLHRSLEVFDAIVVLASFIIDLVFLKGITTLPIQESAYILSFILPWRVIRVVNSLVVAVMDHEHFKLLLLYQSKKHVKRELKDANEDLDIARKQLIAAKKMCVDAGVEEWKFNQSLLKIASNSNFKKVSAISSLASFSASSVVDEKGYSRKSPAHLSVKEDESDKNGRSHAKSESEEHKIESLKAGGQRSHLANETREVEEDEGNYSGGSLNEGNNLSEKESLSEAENTRL